MFDPDLDEQDVSLLEYLETHPDVKKAYFNNLEAKQRRELIWAVAPIVLFAVIGICIYLACPK